MRIPLLVTLLLLASLSRAEASVQFDGSDDILNCGSNSSVDDLNLSGGITVFMWAYIRGAGEGSFGRFISKDQNNSTGRWNFAINNGTATNSIFFQKDYDGITDLSVQSDDNFYSTNEWQSVSFTWDGSLTATNVHIYRNGVEATYFEQQDGTGSPVSDGVRSLCIGNGSGGTGTFNGFISEVAIWNTVLSAEEIKLLHAARVKGLPLTIQKSSLKGYWPMDNYENNGVATVSGSLIDRSLFTNNGSPSGNPVGKADDFVAYQ